MKNEEDLKNLDESIQEQVIQKFDAACVKSKSNLGKNVAYYTFDNPVFKPDILLKDIPFRSPKLSALLSKISELDKADMKKHGKLFKHFIFSDLKTGTVGTKLIASAFIANGYHLGYSAELKKQYLYLKNKQPSKSASNKDSDEESDEESEDEAEESESESEDESTPSSVSKQKKGGGEDDEESKEKKPKKIYEKVQFVSNEQLKNYKNKNFYLLCSSGVYDQPITVAMKKEILRRFNERPDNNYGENVRFIIMDSGYKEGIDLFDIKYIHIFEPAPIMADQKQIIGRGTRTCGQKGLEFHPTRGWPLKVFIYDLEIPDKLRYGFDGSRSGLELYLKAVNLDIRLMNFTHELEKISVFGAVDYELNKNVHMFSIPEEDAEEELPEGAEFVYGGTPNKRRTLRLRRDLPPLIVNSPTTNQVEMALPDGGIVAIQAEREPMNFEETREYVRRNFSQYEWEPVKMENLCVEQKGGGKVLQYTPTQDFVRHYFTPENPLKGMLFMHSVGTGKTCSAIATATTSFEKQGYTILWVTRTTLKADIWKNMFEQVCNESIREQIVDRDLQIPADNKARMKLVSKAWRIRPMSYKQFSNLVAKQNAFYHTLVKTNGEEDPLRKTLLIIDEAHKLYGGDLSSVEQPDTSAFHRAVMNSYIVSGKNSVRLLLMTATPITKSPMEMIQLLNLCKKPEEQFPVNFEIFREHYLDNEGKFTNKGEKTYLDKIAGIISYLNREKDARQFSQPEIQRILVPIIPDMTVVDKFDKKAVRQYIESDIAKIQQELKESIDKANSEPKVTAKDFAFLKDKCDTDDPPKVRAQCKKIVNANIKELVQEAKGEMQKMKETVKELRKMIKERNELRKTSTNQILENRDKYARDYEDYNNSLYYQLKSKCGKPVKLSNAFREEVFITHPEIVQWTSEIDAYNARIEELQTSLKADTESYKNRILRIKKILKTNLSELERSVVNSVLRDERKTMRIMTRDRTRAVKGEVDELKKSIKKTKKEREKKYAKLRKTLKKQIGAERKDLKKIQTEEKKARKLLDKQEGRRVELNERLEELADMYSNNIDEEIEAARNGFDAGVRAKQEQKQREKEEKARAKEQERATRKAQKDAAKKGTMKNKK
jgi:hypothetical protein